MRRAPRRRRSIPGIVIARAEPFAHAQDRHARLLPQQPAQEAEPRLDQSWRGISAAGRLEGLHQRFNLARVALSARNRRGRWPIGRLTAGRRRLELPDHARHLLQVQHRHRRAAVRAHRVLDQVDRRAAVGTVNRLYVLPQLLELLRRERPDEILLPQEIDERDQAPVAAVASPVLKRRAALHVVRQKQAPVAARAVEGGWKQRGWPAGRFADQSEELQGRSGRQAQFLEAVEPDRPADRAQVDLDCRAEPSLECEVRHLGRATGAVHGSRGASAAYFSRTRVPLIFWLLSVLRKSGTMRSINSKYDESAGVFCCALYRISSRCLSEYIVAPVRPSMKTNFGARMNPLRST